MPLPSDQRKEKIQNIKDEGNIITTIKIPYRDKPTYEVEVYQIPWDAIIYNQFNDRIGLSLRTKLNPLGAAGLTHSYDEDLHALIEKELWESAESENKETLKSMQGIDGRPGEQLVPGIITKDGVIVDGNRRAMIARKAGKQFFLAGVLNDLYEGNEEILRDLETQLQFSVESQVDYNPLEKYFKVKIHVDEFGKEYSQLEKLMGPKYTVSKLKKMHQIANLMDEYLAFIGAPGCYDLLLISGTKSSKEQAFITTFDKLESMNQGKFRADYDYNELPESYKELMFNIIRVEAIENPQHYARYLTNKKNTGLFETEQFKDSALHESSKIMNQPTMNLPSIQDMRNQPENKSLDDIAIAKKREEILMSETREPMINLMKELIGKKEYSFMKRKPTSRLSKAYEELKLIDGEEMDNLKAAFDKDEEVITHQLKDIQIKINELKKLLRI